VTQANPRLPRNITGPRSGARAQRDEPA